MNGLVNYVGEVLFVILLNLGVIVREKGWSEDDYSEIGLIGFEQEKLLLIKVVLLKDKVVQINPSPGNFSWILKNKSLLILTRIPNSAGIF